MIKIENISARDGFDIGGRQESCSADKYTLSDIPPTG